MNQILVITTEPLPVPGGLTTGAGLRAWGLAEGLRSRGFPVTLATPLEGDQAMAQSANPTDSRVRYFRRTQLPALIEAEKPDVVVMQHWGLVYALPPLDCPLVIDLAGPHLLERLYWGNPDTARDRAEKIKALSLADFVICGGYYQRHYFYPYLSMAGFDLRSDNFPVIPFSVPPEPIEGTPAPGDEPTFIYGGAFLAWQNPEMSIRWLLEEMENANRGRLLFYGGTHPNIDASGGRFVALYNFLKNHPRVEMRGWKPFTELALEYASEGHVALDLMERNPERELAYTTRTMVYLHCGLPVIYNNYSEISRMVQEKGCGWTLDPADETGFRSLIREILENRETVLALRENARSAAAAQTWNITIEPLADFCTQPSQRTKSVASPPAAETSHETGAPAAPEHRAHISQQLGNFFHRPGKYCGILVYIPVWLLSRYLYYRSRITKESSSRAHN